MTAINIECVEKELTTYQWQTVNKFNVGNAEIGHLARECRLVGPPCLENVYTDFSNPGQIYGKPATVIGEHIIWNYLSQWLFIL